MATARLLGMAALTAAEADPESAAARALTSVTAERARLLGRERTTYDQVARSAATDPNP